MRVLTARWVAGCIAAGSVALMAGGLVLLYVNRHLAPARACPVDHGTGSRSQIWMDARSTVPWYMNSRLS